ncbi:hypothetical protein MNBD_GAMMA03-2086 [hydrothermal vent metagenome]|uniref:HD-GYP domain-containing protein n=1 Tax=hydrothermal vent metagenome TaxID=652676 RepID=A0A3B0W7D8_9ZZZZ
MDNDFNQPKPNETPNGTEVSLQQLYIGLFDAVNFTLSKGVNKQHIEQAINGVVKAFKYNLYNELLLYFYQISKENYIISHIVNNVILAIGFGVSVNLSKDDLMDLGFCAFCHDFGMVEYTHFFQKGHQLTNDENRMVQRHTFDSVKKFEGVFPEKILNAIMDVHEGVNGQGYPRGKTGIEISFLAKMTAICDVFEALTHPRNFRREFTAYEAIKLIIKQKDKVFDNRVVKRFVEFVSIYPIGSFVILNTGETGIIKASNRTAPTKPIVHILLNTKHEAELSGKAINLLDEKMVYVVNSLDSKAEREILHFLKPRGEFNL